MDSVASLTEDLRNLVRREREYPTWLSCTRAGVIVAGLSAADLAHSTGLVVWPVQRVDGSDGSPLRYNFVDDELEVVVDFSSRAIGDVNLKDAQVQIRVGTSPREPGQVDRLAKALTLARASLSE